MKYIESSLEKIARIISRQYGINVVFKGSGACTDGRTIYLPSLPQDVPEDLVADLNGYLDHEAGHCIFTEFSYVSACINPLHKDLLNAVEDVRIERRMGHKFPGCKLHLGPLNKKLDKNIDQNWDKISPKRRIAFTLQDIMLGKKVRIDSDIKVAFTPKVFRIAQVLNSADTTEEVYTMTRQITEEIERAVREEEERKQQEQQQQQQDQQGEQGEGESGEGEEGEQQEGEGQEGQSGEQGEQEGEQQADGKDVAGDDEGEGGTCDGKEGEQEGGASSDGQEGDEGEGEGEGGGQASGSEQGEEGEGEGEGQAAGGEGASESESGRDGEELGDSTEGQDGTGQTGQASGHSEDSTVGQSEGEESDKSERGIDGLEVSETGKPNVTTKDLNDTSAEEVATTIEELVNDKIIEAVLPRDGQDGGDYDPDQEERGSTRVNLRDIDLSAGDKYIPFTTEHDEVLDRTREGNPKVYKALVRQVKPIVNKIKDRIERIFKVKENARWVMDREQGRIASNRIARMIHDKNYNTPFKEYQREETGNIAIQLVIDLSGSMGGRKIMLAIHTCTAIAEALQALGLTFEIVGYDTKRVGFDTHSATKYARIGDAIRLHVFKEFATHKLQGITTMRAGGNNCDGESIRMAARRLAQCSQKRKVMMVFSDGDPNCYTQLPGLLDRDLEDAVREITKSGIEVVGFGILTDVVEKFYPDSIVVNDIDDLPKEAMKKLEKILKNGEGRR